MKNPGFGLGFLISTICLLWAWKYPYHGDTPFWCCLGAFAAILEQLPFWSQIREDGPHRMRHRNGHAWAIERLTRSIYDDVLAFLATEEGQAEYEAWEREQEELKKQKKLPQRKLQQLLLLSGFSRQTVSVVGLLIRVEINK